MTTSTTMTIEEAVTDALAGKKSQILCPGHSDNSPSLSVAPGQNQPVVLNCHAGCDPQQIINEAGLNWSELCAPMEEKPQPIWTPAGDATAVYPYSDAQGTLLYEVLRVDLPGGGKRFLQRKPDATAAHGHAWNLEGVERTLYRLPEVMHAVTEGRTIHVAEGEKCVEALQRIIPEGEQATCNSGGAGKWAPAFSLLLQGANVVLYADADDPGRAHAREVRESLRGVGASVRILEAPPGVLPGGKSITDVADHLAAGRPLEGLLETTPESAAEKARTGFDVLDVILRPMSRVEFVIPNTMAKGERLILIGFEGTGKSTLCRQIGVQVAAGVHPFTQHDMEPRKVLFIDAENHPEQVQESWGHLVGLAARKERAIERGMLTILEEYEGQNTLDSAEGEAWLLERVHAYKPDLIIMGPLTNLASKDLRDDEPVRRIRNTVNKARMICNSAFIMEHHAPLKGSADKERPLRPYGSSLFLKWPDYGFGIKPTEEKDVFEWHKNRGARVRSRVWPDALKEGGPTDWPWVAIPWLPENERR